MKRMLAGILAFAVVAIVAVGAMMFYPMESSPEMDIVETAQSTGNFRTLLLAATEAGLAETLKSDGPFTVFAPTDEAFAKLPEGTIDALLMDKDALRSVLLYHVVSGKVMASDVVNLKNAKTLQGQSVSISTQGGVVIDGAKVSAADIEAKNGVIHVIDSVILPK